MARYHPKHIVHHFWTKESGLSSMLVLLCLNDFLIVPLFGNFHLIRAVINICWMLIFFAGIFSLAKNRNQAVIVSILPFCYIIVRWFLFFYENIHFIFLDFVFGVFTMLMLIAMVLMRVFERGPVTVHRIVGSVVVYLLLGNLFALIFQFMYVIVPGCYNISFGSSDLNTIHSNLLYFSFTTLTTTGYGDIVPVNLFVRSLVAFEQIIGVLYPVVLIGRLVSLKMDRK